MFICNHCPLRKSGSRTHRPGRERITPARYRAQSRSCRTILPTIRRTHSIIWRRIAKEYDIPFPYVWDETQEVAKAYGAVCTPDFFGFNRQLELQYRGRLDASRKEAAPPDVAT